MPDTSTARLQQIASDMDERQGIYMSAESIRLAAQQRDALAAALRELIDAAPVGFAGESFLKARLKAQRVLRAQERNV